MKEIMDINGWQTLGISELATVPYAMAATWATEAAHAKTSDHALIADSVRNMPEGKLVISSSGLVQTMPKDSILNQPDPDNGDIYFAEKPDNSIMYRIDDKWYEIKGVVAGCDPVVAGAGDDFSTSVTTIQMNATAPLFRGTWTSTGGGSATITNSTLFNTSVTLNVADAGTQETFTFRWTVVNDCGNTDYDDITVTYVPNACRGIAQIGHQGDATPMYDVVALGNQCWMQESVTKVVSGSQFSNGYRYYNWSAAQTVCANGWHLPTQSEVTTLYNWYINSGGGRVNFYNDPDGFSPDMAGIKNIHYNPGFEHYGLGDNDRYWTSSIYSSTEAYLLHGNGTRMQLGDHWYNGNDYGTPVRCIKDDN